MHQNINNTFCLFQDYVDSITGDPSGRHFGLSKDNEFTGMYKLCPP